MKILITGAAGFLGRRAAQHFSMLGHAVLAPSHAELDITDCQAVDTWFRQNLPQAVIHCAAVSDTGLCQRQPEWSHRINVEGSVNLARACADTGTKFLLCSSDQVYHASSLPGPHAESEPLEPATVYARQKYLAEQLCQSVCGDTVSLRLSWMYAASSSPGDHPHLLTSLRAALKEPSLPLSWPVYDHRGITDADRVVQNLPAALELPAGAYNFGSENDRDTFHTLQSVFSDLGLEDALNRLSPNLTAFADRPRDIRMDGTLAASHGICFPSTRAGLVHALKHIL